MQISNGVLNVFLTAGALVSYDMIQELLKNPRARSVASSDATPAIDYPSSSADQRSPRDVETRVKTPVSVSPRVKTPTSVSPRGKSSLSSYDLEAASRMSVNSQKFMQDQRPQSRNHESRNGQVSPYDLQSDSLNEPDVVRSDPKSPNVQKANASLQEPPPKTRGQSRIAFAETSAYSRLQMSTDSDKLYANSTGESTRPFRMPTPPQMSNSSPSPQMSKPPTSSRSKKSKSRASSRGKFSQSKPSPDQNNLPDDLRLESVSASASYSTITRTESQASTNTSVSSSDFEYENDDEIQEHILRATPGDDDIQGMSQRLAAARMIDNNDSPEIPYHRPQPKLNRGIHGNKPVLPVDKQRIQGIDNYAKSDDDSDKPFSPVFF